MFKRGGSSFQAQGTGITSPYDTPRKKYKVGTTWKEINERRAGLYQPRSDLSFAMEGFSALGNPYKESGDAKTIGEMLYEGAQGVRKSRQVDDAMGQSVELANIESDADRLSLEEKHARDLELVAANAKSQLNKDYSIERQIMDLTTKLISEAGDNLAMPGADFILDGFAQAVAQGTISINELRKSGAVAMVIPMSAIKQVEGNWDFDVGVLAAGMVYWNPINQKWLIVENARTSQAKEVYFDSYQEAAGGLKVEKSIKKEEKSIVSDPDASDTEIKNNEIKMKITTNLKDVDITDKSVIYDEAAKIGIKIVENPGGSKVWLQNLAENEMSLPAFKKILEKKKMADTYARINKKPRGQLFQETEETQLTEKMATGGRTGYALGSPEYQGEVVEPDTDDYNELTSWWKSEVANSFNS